MMKYTEAMKTFKQKFPKLTITRCIDYDKEHFVIEAVENIEKEDFNSPYYAVDKRNGKLTGFIPGFDLEAFFDAVENRMVYSID